MRKAIQVILLLCGLFLPLSVASAADDADAVRSEPWAIAGGFEMAGYMSTGAGWQRFNRADTTEFAADGSYAGVLGSVIPNIYTAVAPVEGQDNLMFFLEAAELDIAKSFGERASLTAHLIFGRAASGSWTGIDGFDLEQGYATVVLSKAHNVALQVGRFGTPMGFESYEPYNNDMISWCILTRAYTYISFSTGAALSADVTDHLWIFLAVSNGLINDTTSRLNTVPCGYLTFKYHWGDEEHESSLAVTSFGGPDSDSNRHLSYGADVTLNAWLTDRFQLGLQADVRRDNAVSGGVNTLYAGTLLNLHYDFTEQLYGALKYCFLRQFAAGNGVLNLTGQEQDIHEFSIGGGYALADGVKFKAEARFDLIDPAGAADQWVPGLAIGLVNAF